jgi:regulator of sigma E protease
LFGIRVDKFYLFFDAWDVKLFSTKSKWFLKICPKAAEWETEYGIGWLPFGGYCKISGMIDESMDKEQLQGEPQSWEFRTKPAWQRLFVMAGGVLFNFILAIFVYIGILAAWGESYISNDGKQIYVNELASEMGFRSGDHIISFDEYEPENFGMLQADLAREMAQKAVVLRDSDTVDIYIDQSRIGDVLKTPGMFDLALPFVVDSIPAASVNYGAELASGDRIIAVAGKATEFVQDAWPILEAGAGSAIDVTVLRGADTLAMALQVDTTGRLGILLAQPEVSNKEYGFWNAIPAGFSKTFSTIGGYIKDLKLVFTPSTEAYKSVGSFISIGQIFPATWDWFRFMNILALLSIMLGVMNLLPIPALDGGHIVFTLYEIITRRKPSDKFLEVMQIIGMILIFGLMILAFGNDIIKLFR